MFDMQLEKLSLVMSNFRLDFLESESKNLENSEIVDEKNPPIKLNK